MIRCRLDEDGSRGFALALVLYALTLLSLMATAVFFVAWQEMRSSRSAIDAVLALARAESAADSLVSHWNESVFTELRVGNNLLVELGGSKPAGFVRAKVTKTG